MDKKKKILISVAAIIAVGTCLLVSYFTEGETSHTAIVVAPIPAFLLLMLAAVLGNRNDKDQ